MRERSGSTRVQESFSKGAVYKCCRISGRKSFAIFIGKHLFWSDFLRIATLITVATGGSLEIL